MLLPIFLATALILVPIAMSSNVFAQGGSNTLGQNIGQSNIAGDTLAKCKAGLLSAAVCKAASSQSNVNTGSNIGGQTAGGGPGSSGPGSSGGTNTLGQSINQANPQSSLANIIIFKTGNLGPQDKGDFNAEVTGNHPSPAQVNLGGDEIYRTVKVRPGSYNVHEVGESGGTLERGYNVTYSENCSGTIKNGETVTCTITNDFTGSYP